MKNLSNFEAFALSTKESTGLKGGNSGTPADVLAALGNNPNHPNHPRNPGGNPPPILNGDIFVM
jgi:hypothetical protein